MNYLTRWLNRFDPAQAKKTLILVFCAFAGFVLACLAFGKLTDPRAPFDAVAQTHTEIGLLFQLIGIGFDLACLAVLVGGLPILYDVARRAIVGRRRNILLLLIVPLLLAAAAVVENVIVFQFLVPGGITSSNATPLNVILTLSAQVLFLLAGVACIIGPALAVARSEISPRALRFALALVGVVILAMLLTLAATIAWGLRVLADAPQLFTNGAIALGFLSGAAWLALIVGSMAVVIGIPIAALIRSLPRQVRRA